jgi:hypothetical protein
MFKSDRTSQQGRVYRYLKDQGGRSKGELTKKAINAFYLVDALVETGTRSREDIQQIGQRCITDLLAQVDRINRITGLNYTLVSDSSKPKRDRIESEESDDSEQGSSEENFEDQPVEGWEEKLPQDQLDQIRKAMD